MELTRSAIPPQKPISTLLNIVPQANGRFLAVLTAGTGLLLVFSMLIGGQSLLCRHVPARFCFGRRDSDCNQISPARGLVLNCGSDWTLLSEASSLQQRRGLLLEPDNAVSRIVNDVRLPKNMPPYFSLVPP